MKKLVNWTTYDSRSNPRVEVVLGVSCTVPGMTLSLAELLKRHVRGGDVTVYEGVYSDDPDIPDNLERMTEIERIDLAREIRVGIDDARGRLNADAVFKKQKAKEDEQRKLIEAKQKSSSEGEGGTPEP